MREMSLKEVRRKEVFGNIGREVKVNVLHSRIFYGYQKSSFLFSEQGFR